MPDVQDILTSSAEPDYGIDFPVSIYERPMHAMSNLLLRGNVDAATRAIFQPDTLSPTEMKTLTNRFAGPNPSPLIKTILDVATNPLVIGGLIGGYLLYPAVGGATLAKVFSGMRAGVPKTGLLGDFVGASYSRLRHLVKPAVKGKPAQSMLGAIQDVNQSIGHFVERHQLWRAEAYGHMGTSVGKGGAAGRRIAAMSQGWNKGLDSDLRHVLGKYMDDVPMTPGLQGKMSRDELTAVGKIKKGLAKLYDEVIPENMRATFEAEAKKRGTTLGKERENFFPHTGTPNELRRKIIQYGEYDPVTKKGVVNYRKPLADNLKRRKGWNIPDPVELREMEAAGDITKGFTDKLMQAVDLDVAEFTTKLRAAVAQAKPTQEGMTAAINEAAKSMDISGHYVKEAASNIFSVVASPTGKSMAGQSLDDVITWAGKMLRTPGTYSMDLDPVLTRYATKMGQSYGWLTAKATGSAKTLGQTADDLIDYFRTTTGPNGKILMPAGGPVDHYLTQQLIPMNLGQKSAKAVARSSKWATWRQMRADALKTPMAQKLIPKDSRQWMIKNLEDMHTLDIDAVGHGINEYLYISTMGANIGPPSKNIFQNILTFGPLSGMGPDAWAVGMRETFKRARGYMGDFRRMGGEKAFREHFGEFVDQQGPRSGLVEKLFGGQVQVDMPATGVRRGIEKVKEVMMAPFQFSELWANRIPAFYGARAKGLQWNVGSEAVKAKGLTGKAARKALDTAANQMASNVVDMSHFTGGPMGMPSGVMDLWAPLRQFMQFPFRTVDFMLGSTRLGADPTKLDFGTLSRMIAASAATYTVGKNLAGVDVSPGLMAGALPLPQYEGSAFYPFPFVPPIAQIAGDVVKGVATGDTQPLANVAPLLIPGGLAAKRLIKTLGTKRADYKNRLTDGRIPVYNDRNGLVGAYSPMQLTLRSMGIMPIEVAAERGAAKWLVSQRDQIREFRQKWLEANIANDPVKADRIQQDFQTKYPEMGKMKFKKSDINSIEQRRDTARIGRVMRGLPKAYKPLFQNIIQEAQLGAFTQTLPKQPLPAGLEALR